MPQFINSIEYTDTEGSKVTLDGITSVSTVDASTLSVTSAQEAQHAVNATNIIPDENGAVNPLGRKDDGAVGVNSTAFGNNSTASADSSTALGYGSKASNTSSMALGDTATASGEGSIALGRSSTASGESSTALGDDANASGTRSTAIGHSSKALNMNSTALGYYSTASGDNATALGYYSEASNGSSIAIGNQAEASGMNSIALGLFTIAPGDYSTAIGKSSKAWAVSCTALGEGSDVRGGYSTALGYNATVPGEDSGVIQLGNNDLSALRCAVELTRGSDKRDKTDIASITDALAFIERLTPVTFVRNDRVKYISDEDKKGETFHKYGMCDYDRIAHAAGTKKGERRRCGLLAQEVVEALQTVYGTDNYADIVNDNFHDLTEKPSDVENKYTLAYANLVPFLIGAVKELSAKIKVLEGKLATSGGADAQEN